tara:strand:- start:5217 stop:5477 length:261 start_codon:yes stop_codon:yes gene_type:complete
MKFHLIEITCSSNIHKPKKSIQTTTNQDSAEKAALFFMASAFKGTRGDIKALVKVQKNSENLQKTHSVNRVERVLDKKVKYIHYIS